MGRPLPRVPGLGHGRRGRRPARAHASPPARSPRRRGRSARSRADGARASPDRRRRARPGARRRAGARRGGAARRRARRRQVDAAARRAPPRSRASGRRCSIVTGEESAAQVRLRADRIGALADDLYLAAETDLAAVLGHVDAVQPDAAGRRLGADDRPAAEVDGAPGGVTQVREVAAALIRVAKERGIATVLVGHVTKDGSIAGPAAARAPGRRRPALRGRPALAAAPGPRGQEPVRAGRRGRLLRPDRRRHRRAAPTRAGCSCPARPSRCRAPASP